MEETISLKEIFETLKKRIWMIIAVTLLATIASGLISYMMLTPIYEGKTQIIVQSKSNQNQFDFNQVQTNLKLVDTYSVIIKSPTILDNVIKRLHLKMSAGQLKNQLTVSNEQNSQVLNVAVDNPSPKKAVKIANTIAEVFKQQIVKIMNVNNVSILSKANLGSHPQPVKPSPKLNMAIAFVVGLMVGVGIAFLLEYLDNTINTEQDVEELLELPVLGVVTKMNESEQLNLGSKTTKRRMGSESLES